MEGEEGNTHAHSRVRTHTHTNQSVSPVSSCSTLEERARRLFATKGKSLQELDQSMFAKSKASKDK